MKAHIKPMQKSPPRSTKMACGNVPTVTAYRPLNMRGPTTRESACMKPTAPRTCPTRDAGTCLVTAAWTVALPRPPRAVIIPLAKKRCWFRERVYPIHPSTSDVRAKRRSQMSRLSAPVFASTAGAPDSRRRRAAGRMRKT